MHLNSWEVDRVPQSENVVCEGATHGGTLILKTTFEQVLRDEKLSILLFVFFCLFQGDCDWKLTATRA